MRGVKDVSEWGALTTNPVILGNIVYFQDLKSNICAVDLITGKQLWMKAPNLFETVGKAAKAVKHPGCFSTWRSYLKHLEFARQRNHSIKADHTRSVFCCPGDYNFYLLIKGWSHAVHMSVSNKDLHRLEVLLILDHCHLNHWSCPQYVAVIYDKRHRRIIALIIFNV
jgi:hypothetical protein